MLSVLAGPVQAQRLALPPEEQDAVNRAIRRGVDFLKASQFKTGTWAKSEAPHQVGYSALPGLTLLECGVPPTDPTIKHAAAFIRSQAAKIDRTYELALSILFLDRLGDPRDRKLIQTFALRLIAGQSATGGWGYKCPNLPPAVQAELLVALRHLNPPREGVPGGGRDPVNLPGIAGRPDDLTPVAQPRRDLPSGVPARKPGDDLIPAARTPGDLPSGGPARKPGDPPSGTTSGGSPGSSQLTPSSDVDARDLLREWLGFNKTPPENKKATKETADAKGRPQPDKGNARDAGPNDNKNNDNKNNGPGSEAKGADGKPAPPRKPFVIPERLRRLPVLQDPEIQVLADPTDKREELIVSTTDNSNTQFAILALWTAQRHRVPTERSLKLIVRRYETSQNPDGTWSYDYIFGGGGGGSPAMTSVGLIGLAVGHGLANAEAGGPPVRDRRILNGLTALSRFVGQPAEQIVNLRMQNLYFLWSLERVAVLYNLPKIGDKDWYRWGAQILVANQDLKGNWANGQYPGSSEPLDTCLALLFLKRANLVRDLTSRLPFKAADLNSGVLEKLAPPPTLKAPGPIENTPSKPVEPAKPPDPETPPSKPPLPALEGTTASSTPSPEATTSGDKKKWVGLGIVLFIVFVGGGLFLFFLITRRSEDEEKPAARKKRKVSPVKRKVRSRPAPSDAGV
jgi:hypothetical protein